jgi:MoaA/NifB/PqqE/SkfB family radical SAM enzyme
MLLNERRLQAIEGKVDLIAISLDGVPESHNRMRASDQAFERMAANLPRLRETGIPFGFIFTLTQYNLNELSWVAQFALEQGGGLLQVHPLEITGRAVETLSEEAPDVIEASFAYVEAMQLLAFFQGRMRVQIDLVRRGYLRSNPERFYASPLNGSEAHKPLGELVTPLILETDGTVAPLLHGFSRRYALGNIKTRRLAELSREWRRETLPEFRRLCRWVYDEQTSAEDEYFFNWYEAVARASRVDSIPVL